MITSPTLMGYQGSVARRPLPVGAADPYWADTVLLLNGNAVSDATGRHTLIQHEGEVTASGGWLIFDGNSSLRIDDNLTDFAFPGAFTIDAEIVGDTTRNATMIVMSNYVNTGTWQVFVRGSPGWGVGFYGEGGQYLEQATAVVTDAPASFGMSTPGTPNSFRLYANGTKLQQVDGGQNNNVPSPSPSMFIGRESPTSGKLFKGKMRLRVTKNVARMVGDTYTPPTFPLPTHG
jgi:hypothetical protein